MVIICEILIFVMGLIWALNPRKIVEQQSTTRLKKGKPAFAENEIAKKINSARIMGIVFALIGVVGLVTSFMGF